MTCGLLSGLIKPPFTFGANGALSANTASPSTSDTPYPVVTTTSPSSSPYASPNVTVTTSPAIREPLKTPGVYWVPTDESAKGLGRCAFQNDSLVVRIDKSDTYRCAGDPNHFANFIAQLEVTLSHPDSCAAIWFRNTNFSGYLLEVCGNRYRLYDHHDLRKDPLILPQMLDAPVPIRTKFTVKVVVTGTNIKAYHDGQEALSYTDTTYSNGSIRLGISVPSVTKPGPYEVTFNNLVVYRLS